MKQKNNLASPDRYGLLKNFAKKNREYATFAEKYLWFHLRASQLGFKFNRQHIIGDYIVDFVCIEKQLVIEVDGSYHCEVEQMKYDQDRTLFLRSLGFSVLRFTNEEVQGDLERVLTIIRNCLR